MNLKYSIPFLLIILLPGLSTWALTSDHVKNITFDNYVEPTFPYSLIFEGIVEGVVDIAVDINEDGTVADWLPLRSSNEDLTREIERVIDQWIFKPYLKDGVSEPIVYELHFIFSVQGVTLSGGNLTQLFLNQIVSRSMENRLVYSLSELDGIPEPINLIDPKGVKDENGENIEGKVLIEFFIDAEGKVRLPVVRTTEGPIELAYSAYSAITRWKFAPPLRRGKPVAVRVRQAFVFSDDN